VMRDALPFFLDEIDPDRAATDLSPAAREVAAHLRERGASFLSDIARAVRRLPAEVEEALWQLVSRGLVSGDGVAGLRRLLQPSRHGDRRRARALAASHRLARMSRSWSAPGLIGHGRPLPVGRWALWQTGGEPAGRDDRVAAWARQLLRRYGVVVRELLERERGAPPWRALLDVYRRWEAQGEIRGGRFVAGTVGEQFALAEAVEALRAVRRAPEDTQPVVIAGGDPLNLVGILLPGERVTPASGMAIALRNGVPVETGPLGALLRHVRDIEGLRGQPPQPMPSTG